MDDLRCQEDTKSDPKDNPRISSRVALLSPKYRSDIDGLRAIAVLAVIVFHAFPETLSGGYIGVDVFFVISGYLISTIVLQNVGRGSFTFGGFYARRVRRIFPALLLVLSCCCVFGWFALLADEYRQLGEHIAAGAGFISNFILYGETGYFDNAAETKPLLHLWSLGVEEQFYLVWPALVWLMLKAKLNPLSVTLWIVLGSFALNVAMINTDAAGAFYLPLTRFWELLCGGILSCVQLNAENQFENRNGLWPRVINLKERLQAQTYDILSIGGAFILISSFCLLSPEFKFPGAWALPPVIATMLIIAAGPDAWFNRTVLAGRLLVWIGLISFPLYLWHWPLLSFARIIESELPSAAIRALLLIAAVLLAGLTYRFVESPLRSATRANVKIAFLLIVAPIVAGVGYTIYKLDGIGSRPSITETSAANSQFVGPLWKYTKNDICERRYPLPEAREYGWWFCMASSLDKPTLLLLGNSYANHLYPGFVNNTAFLRQSVLSIGTCDPGWVDSSKLQSVVSRSPCSGHRSYEQMEFIDGILRSEHSIRYVIMSGLNIDPNREYIENLRKRIEFIEQQNARVILFVPHVRIDYDIKGCYSRPFKQPKHSCQLPVSAYHTLVRRFSVLVESIKTTNPSVLVFDQNVLFCNDKLCTFRLPTMPAFRDEYGHLSEYASNLLIARFAEWAKINAPDLLSN